MPAGPTPRDEEHAQLIVTLKTWSLNTREYDLFSFVETLAEPPSALAFARDYVGRNRPVLIEGAVAGWPALQKWRDDEYLAGALGDAQVTVALTPGGRADALEPAPPGVDAACVFALPAERRMALAAFFQLLAARDGPVAYLQYQNSSLTAEAPQLLADVAPELAWASQAFGTPPEAINLWIGDERSVTSWHRDHYENVYVVVAGVKHFALLPPADGWRMGVRSFPQARWAETVGSGLELRPTGDAVLWSTAPPAFQAESPGPGAGASGGDGPADGAAATHVAPPPYYAASDLPAPIHVSVRPGQTLYLPAGWWHCVAQGPRTLAVNYWHDRHWGAAAAAAAAADALAVCARLADPEP